MQSVSAGTRRSAAATARRRQIIAATTEVIADQGLAKASFARIGLHAGLSSTRLISYHFTDKDELLAAVVADVVESMASYLSRRIGRETTARGRLHAYIEGTVEFTATHRAAMAALVEIFLGGAMDYDLARGGDERQVVGHVESILRDGQRGGEFRDFDARVVATAVQRAVETLPLQLRQNPGLDTAAWARELVLLFDLGTRRGKP